MLTVGLVFSSIRYEIFNLGRKSCITMGRETIPGVKRRMTKVTPKLTVLPFCVMGSLHQHPTVATPKLTVLIFRVMGSLHQHPTV
ncbi:hypothetical protein MAR_003760, partial [Mya arenaria]